MTLTPEQIAAGWIAHDGGDCPVAEGAVVELMYRGPGGDFEGWRFVFARAGQLDWSHDGGADDIIAYVAYRPEQP